MAQTTTFTPLQLFQFFYQTRDSLPDDSEFTELTSLLLTPRYMLTVQDLMEAALPYFDRASDSTLKLTFQSIVAAAQSDPNFEGTLARVLESFYLLDRVSDVLGDEQLLAGYMVALKIDDPSASHQQVMKSLNDFMNNKLSPEARDALKKVLLETEVSAELGITDSSLYDLSAILSPYPNLYNSVLAALKLNTSENLPWETIEVRVQRLVNAQQPSLWYAVSGALEDIQRACGNYQDDTVYYNVDYTYQNYIQQQKAEADAMQENFNNLSVASQS